MIKIGKYAFYLILAIIGIFSMSGCGNEDRTVSFRTASFLEETGEGTTADFPLTEASGTESKSGAEKEEERIYVYICGMVAEPGVYCLDEGARVNDALCAAGGFSEDADRSAVNLAQKLKDGEKIYFPAIGETGALQEADKPQENELVNVNTADETRLCTLPGIGSAKAKEIIAYREKHGAFGTVEEIMDVPGIKQNIYDKIRPMITVE